MCGVAAIYTYHPSGPPVAAAAIDALTAHMAARGPDDADTFADDDDDARVRLGHRRLAIIDLDRRSAQPMVSGCGRFVLSFNGEIYNYRALRAELESRGVRFRTTSDTEVALELFARDGEAAFARLRGMFALALHDLRERVLRLVRDPYGIKPLYYADDGWTVRSASSLKALIEAGGVAIDPEPAGIVGFFLTGSVPEPFTCYQEVRAVPAGTVVRVDSLGAHDPVPFASLAATLRAAEAAAVRPADPRATMHELLLDSVRHHLVADVPVGLFLSAGIDSSALLALMAEARGVDGAPVAAVTVAFAEYRGSADDEAPLAAAMAARARARHTVVMVDRAGFEAELPRIMAAMDQPTIDGVNTWFVCKAARERGLKVALSGLGGDELFGGYPSFRGLPRALRALAVPARIPFLGRASRAVLGPLAAARGWHPKSAGLLELGGTWAGAYLLQRGLFLPAELGAILEPEVVRRGLERLAWGDRTRALLEDGPRDGRARVALLESALYMRNQLLRDTDWTSMAHSLEVRVPLVDLELLRQAAPLALQGGKALLADSAGPALPTAVRDRPKTGFTTPLGRWLDQLAPAPAASRSEPWARRWARLVGRTLLPDAVFREPARPAEAMPTPALDRLA